MYVYVCTYVYIYIYMIYMILCKTVNMYRSNATWIAFWGMQHGDIDGTGKPLFRIVSYCFVLFRVVPGSRDL